jgi:PPK2 family polyphosphate:nucleotide phosphotransferase
MKLHPVRSRRDILLDDDSARAPSSRKSEEALERAMDKQVERISDLQRVFYADERFALLIVLQGRDASGKDGTIRKVFSAVNPQGCSVSSFKRPTDLELHHDYLWRVHRQVPARGMIGIFNRSHYEDVIVPVVAGALPKRTIRRRYAQINDFERMLTENAVVILKFLLHISRDEQLERLRERLENPAKNWKFNPGDLEDRKLWDKYMAAYEEAIRNTSTADAPWHVVPADKKWFARLVIAHTIADALENLGLEYPKVDAGAREALKKAKAALEAEK